MSELRHLRELLFDPRGRGVVVAGPAGVGKTRLAVECLDMAERAGLVTARVTATRAASGLPLGALAPLLPTFDHGEGGGTDHRGDLLRRCADALLDRAGRHRLMLLVDDAHLLDSASATLVHQLAASGSATVLATVRTGEPAPDPIVALWKDGVAERVELRGLTAGAVEEVLAAALGGNIDPADADHFAFRCRGNALFLRELVLGALGDGTLRDDGGIWRLAGPLSPSDRLVELLHDRLGNLSPDERALLELVSFGEPLGPAELAAAFGGAGDPELALHLERKGLLHSAAAGRRLEVRLAHPLYGDVIRARIPELRIRTIARALAEVVEASGARRREDTLRVGTWRLHGGGANADVMLAAATTARSRYDFPLAERLARAAVDAGAGFPGALLAARLTSLQGRGEEAETELAALAPSATTEFERRDVATARLDNHVYRGRIQEGIRVAEEAEADISDPAARDEIAAQRAVLLLALEGPAAAAEATAPLLAHAGGRALAWASFVATFSLGRLGRFAEATAACTQGRAVHLALSRPLEWYPSYHLWLEGLNLAQAGRFADAEALATAQYEAAVAERSTEAQACFAWLFAQMVADRGDVGSAERRAREAGALLRHRPPFANECLVHLALALALSGAATEAAGVLCTLDASGPPTMFFGATDLLQARAWTAVAAGDVPRGRAFLEEAVTVGVRRGDRIGHAAALHGLARLGYAAEVAEPLGVLGEQVEGVLVPARAAHARALAQRDPLALEEVAGSFDAMGAALLAAEAAADAAGAWRRKGEPRRAKAGAQRAATLAARCEGAATPALRAMESRDRLTRAEHHVALLAAGGRSNREIADEIHLSVRTVETHLGHVYEKLGISGRAGLAPLLERLPTEEDPAGGRAPT